MTEEKCDFDVRLFREELQETETSGREFRGTRHEESKYFDETRKLVIVENRSPQREAEDLSRQKAREEEEEKRKK